jgi:hypothetical protein
VRTRFGVTEEDDRITFGFRVRPQNVADRFICLIRGINGSVDHVSLYRNSAGEIVAYRGNGVTELARSAPNTLVPTRTDYLEVQVLCADAGGRVIVRKNKQAVIDFTGDTRNGGADAILDEVLIGTNNSQLYIADLYFLNEQGAAPHNDFLNPIVVQCLNPTGAGSASNFTGSDGNSVDNHLLVDDATQDGDATYVESNVATTLDLHGMEDVSVSAGNVRGLIERIYARDTGGGGAQIKGKIRTGGANHDGATVTLGSSYSHFMIPFPINPGTAATWTLAEINAVEAGYEVV